MPNIKVVGGDTYQFGGVSPYGNLTVLRFGYDTNRIGAVISSDTQTAVAAGDKVYVGTVPQGFVFVSAVGTTLGFEYADGVNDASVPQGANIATTLLKPLPKLANVYITAVAATGPTQVRAAITGELQGPK